MESELTRKFGINPSLNEKALQIMCLSREEFCEKSFTELNKVFGTEFPIDSNGESHRILFEELKTVVSKDVMTSPLELILKSNGLWIRICSPHIGIFDEANKLANKLNLSSDRISHSLCDVCEKKERARASAAISGNRRKTRESLFKLSLPASEVPAIAKQDTED
jgi:hypothetical protein